MDLGFETHPLLPRDKGAVTSWVSFRGELLVSGRVLVFRNYFISHECKAHHLGMCFYFFQASNMQKQENHEQYHSECSNLPIIPEKTAL